MIVSEEQIVSMNRIALWWRAVEAASAADNGGKVLDDGETILNFERGGLKVAVMVADLRMMCDAVAELTPPLPTGTEIVTHPDGAEDTGTVQ
jgi:hypothetical protein